MLKRVSVSAAASPPRRTIAQTAPASFPCRGESHTSPWQTFVRPRQVSPHRATPSSRMKRSGSSALQSLPRATQPPRDRLHAAMLSKQPDSACGPTRGWHSICNRVPTPGRFHPRNRRERSAETFCGIFWLQGLSVLDELLFGEVMLVQDCWRACRKSLTDWIHQAPRRFGDNRGLLLNHWKKCPPRLCLSERSATNRH